MSTTTTTEIEAISQAQELKESNEHAYCTILEICRTGINSTIKVIEENRHRDHDSVLSLHDLQIEDLIRTMQKLIACKKISEDIELKRRFK